MAFRFSWKFFNLDELYETCKGTMTQSIAKSRRPPEIAEALRVVDIDFGLTPPELILHSLPEVSESRAHLVFKLKYSGNAQVTLQSKVQANPFRILMSASPSTYPTWIRPTVVGAQSGLLLPFIIRLYGVQMDTLVDVIYTQQGVVVTLRNDPIKNVNAETSLDIIPGVSKMIDSVIKVSLAETFQEDVPEAVFKASSPEKQFPDPSFGARRAFHQHTKHKRFLELGRTVRTPAVCKPFHSLTIGTHVEHSIPSRVCLRPYHRPSKQSRVSVQDILEMTPQPGGDGEPSESGAFDTLSERSSSSISSHQQKRPHRRVIKLRKSLPETPILTYSESPVFESPPHADPPILARRHSIPAPLTDEMQGKIRTASLQPSVRPSF